MLASDLGELDARVLGDDVPAEGHCEVLQFGDAAVPEAWRTHDDRLHRPVHVAADEQLQGGAVDVFGYHHQRPIGPFGHLDGRHDLLDLADLLVGEQDQGLSRTASMRS